MGSLTSRGQCACVVVGADGLEIRWPIYPESVLCVVLSQITRDSSAACMRRLETESRLSCGSTDMD